MSEARKVVQRIANMHERIAASVPEIARGQVWCRQCRATLQINGGNALRYGWPKCCGATMTIDAPETWKNAP